MSDWMTGERSGQGRLFRWSWCLVVLLVAITGCSYTTTAYRFADRIILWKADHYFDLNSAQRHELAERLTPMLNRHRREACRSMKPSSGRFDSGSNGDLRDRISIGPMPPTIGCAPTSSSVSWPTAGSFSPQSMPGRCAPSNRPCRRTMPKPRASLRHPNLSV